MDPQVIPVENVMNNTSILNLAWEGPAKTVNIKHVLSPIIKYKFGILKVTQGPWKSYLVRILIIQYSIKYFCAINFIIVN